MGKRGHGGRGRFARKKQRAAGAAAEDAWREGTTADWVYSNDAFIAYYQAQGVVPSEEWESFMKHLATPLPSTFRINNSCPFAEKIRQHIAEDFKFDGLMLDDDQPVDPISPMAWYPDNRGYQWSVERRRIRKLPALAGFQKWLIELSDAGSITRQEAVSMIPPLVLGVEPHHRVLDMCAAPGSKTSQLLESLHAQEHITGETPTGMVLANDVDLKRSYMLVHQSKRMVSPALLVTCHEAQHFPFLGGEDERKNGFFDRVLCDAPCSGDGTLRKNPIIWKQWDPKNGISLHPLQLEIAKRGASLLKIGGFMCYSTCSFNPIENEAVVAELLRWSQGALELVDVTNVLPKLKRRAGVSMWKVMDSKLKEYKTIEEFKDPANETRRNPQNCIRPTMFPPSDDEAKSFHLERCMRCVPQDENTGGFFICLLKKVLPTPDNVVPEAIVKDEVVNDEKKKEIDASAEQHTTKDEPVESAAENTGRSGETTVSDATAEARQNEEEDNAVELPGEETSNNETTGDTAAASTDGTAPKKQLTRRERRQYTARDKDYVSFNEEQFAQIKEHYGLLPEFSLAQLITRSDECKTITFTTKSITMPLLDEMKQKGLKVVYTGSKIFERNEVPGGDKVYRLCQSGLRHALPYVTLRKTLISPRDLQMLLERHGELLDFNVLEERVAKALEDSSIGTIICILDHPQLSIAAQMVLNVVLWRGRNSVNLMAARPDVTAMLSTMKELGLYDPKVHDEAIQAQQAEKARRAEFQAQAQAPTDA